LVKTFSKNKVVDVRWQMRDWLVKFKPKAKMSKRRRELINVLVKMHTKRDIKKSG